MKIQRMPEDIVPLIDDLKRRIVALETRPLGTVYVTETIVAKDPETGVETVMGDLSEYGEDRTGIKQWVNDTEPPPIPDKPIVTTNLGVFSLVWTGLFKDDAPMVPDFSHINVYGNDGTATKLVGVIKTKDEVAIVTLSGENMYDQVWSFYYTSVDQVGNESLPSEISLDNKLTPLVESPDIQGAIDEIIEKTKEDFEKAMESANGKNRIWHTPEPPVADPIVPFIDGDTWFDTNDGNKIYIWNSTPAPGSWEAAVLDSSALDDKITDAIEGAATKADEALTTANGKSKAYHQDDPPSGTNYKVGDIWFDTNDSNKVYVWDGSKWDPSTASAEIPQDVLDDILEAKDKADQAYTLANGKNKRIDSTNNPPETSTGYSNGDHWLKWSNLGTTGVLLQSWTVKNDAWVLDSMDPTYLPKVDIGQGTFGSLNGDRLDVNSVKADRILVSATDNLIRDPNFNFPDTMWVNQTSEMGAGPEKWSTDITYAGGARSMVLTQKPQGSNQASYAATPSDYFEVVPGDSYAAFSMVYSDNGTDPSMTNIAQRVYFYDKNKSIISGGPGNVDAGRINGTDWTTQTWNKVGGNAVATAPANAAYMKPRVTVYRTANTAPGTRKYYVGSISVMRAMDSTLITPGAVQTPHIATGSITAESGIIASLDAGKIITGSMHGKYIEAGTLLASKLAVRNNENLLPNLTYEKDDWVLTGGTTIVNSTLSSEGKRFSFPATALAQAIAYDVQVIPGEKYKVEANTYATTATQNLEICWFGRDGSGASAGSAVLVKSTTGNQKLSAEWTVPDNVFSVRFSLRVPSTAPVNTVVTGAYNFTARKMTGGTLIEDGAITTEKVKALELTAENGTIATLDASVINAGTMHGKYIEAGTIMSNRLVVGDFNNYATIDATRDIDVSNPAEWATDNDGEWTYSKAGSASYLFFMDRQGPIPFETEDQFRVSFTAYSTVAGNHTMRGYFYNGPDGGSITYTPTVTVPLTTTASNYSYVVTVPNISSFTGTGSWIYGFYNTSANNVRVKNVTIRRMTKGSLVVDGTILADHIHSDSIETRHLKANVVTADKIESGSIKTSHLAVGTGRELVGNGSGQLKNNNGFEGFTYVARAADVPVGHPGYFRSTAGQKTTNFLTGDNILRIKPNTKYKIKTWVKANATGSKVYLEPMVGSTVAGERPIPTYAISDRDVPTSWTLWEEIIQTTGAPSGTMYFRWFLNHTNGTNVNSIFYFTGFSVEEMVEGTIISDNSISTGKLTIGSFDNLIPDPTFVVGKDAWDLISTSQIVSSASSLGGPVLRITNSSNAHQTVNNVASFPVAGGESFNLKMRVKTSVTAPIGSLWVFIRAKNRSTGTESYPYVSNDKVTVANTWTEFNGIVTVPENTSSITFAVSSRSTFGSGYVDFEFVSATRASSGELIVDGAIDGKIVTGAIIQTSKNDEEGIKLSKDGLKVWGPMGGLPTLSITAGQGVDYIGIWGHRDVIENEDGTLSYPPGVDPEQVATITVKGEITGETLVVDDASITDTFAFNGEAMDGHGSGEYGMTIMGRDLLGATYTNFFMDNHEQSGMGWLTPMPHGLLSNSYHNGWGGTSGDYWTVEGLPGRVQVLTHLRDTVEIKNGRGYLITYTTPAFKTTDGKAGSPGASVVKYAEGRTLGVDAGRALHGSRYYLSESSDFDNPGRTVYAVGGQDLPTGDVTLGVEIYVYDGRKIQSTTTADARYWSINILDVGSAVKGNTGDSSSITKKMPTEPTKPPVVDPPPPVKPPAKKTYTTTWNARWWGTWWVGNGDGVNSGMKSPKVAQGRPPGVGSSQRGLISFPDMTGTVRNSTIKKVEVYVYASHWYSSAGGTLEIGTHSHYDKPTKGNVKNDGTTANLVTNRKSQALKKPEGRWVTLPTTVHSGILSGTVRGIQAYTTSTSLSRYGYLDGSRSKIRVTYEK